MQRIELPRSPPPGCLVGALVLAANRDVFGHIPVDRPRIGGVPSHLLERALGSSTGRAPVRISASVPTPFGDSTVPAPLALRPAPICVHPAVSKPTPPGALRRAAILAPTSARFLVSFRQGIGDLSPHAARAADRHPPPVRYRPAETVHSFARARPRSGDGTRCRPFRSLHHAVLARHLTGTDKFSLAEVRARCGSMADSTSGCGRCNTAVHSPSPKKGHIAVEELVVAFQAARRPSALSVAEARAA